MEGLDKLVMIALYNYYNTLSKFGYISQANTEKVLILCLLEEILRYFNKSNCITECDYRIIIGAIYCLCGSTCLIPYPEVVYTEEGEEDLESLKITENSILRFTELGFLRLVDE